MKSLILASLILLIVQGTAATAESLNLQTAQNQTANTSLSLKDVQSTALSKNREVQQAVLEVGKSEAAVRAVHALRLPLIAGFAFVGQQATVGYEKNLLVLPGIFQPLTQQYRLSMQESQANLDLQIARQQLRLAKQAAVAEAKKTYLRMVALQSGIASRQQNLAFLTTLVSYVEAEVKRGSVLEVDLMIVKARKARTEFELDRDKNDYVTLGQTLNRLLQRPLSTPVLVADESSETSMELLPESANAQSELRRPEVAAIKLSVHKSGLEKKVELSHYIPDISFGATGIFSRNLDITFPRSVVSIGFLGVWQPWDFGRRINLAKVADRQRSERLVALSDLTDKVSIEVDNARRVLKVVEKEVTAAELDKTSSAEELRIANRRYKAGAALIKDIMEAQANYSEAISEEVKAKSDYSSAQVDFDRAIGKDFD